MIENTDSNLNTLNPTNQNSGGGQNDSNGNGTSVQTASAATSSGGDSGPKLTSNSAPESDAVPKGLTVWRDAVQRSNTSAQLAMCLYMLEASIAWDKSIMKAVRNSAFASSQLLLNRITKRARCIQRISVGDRLLFNTSPVQFGKKYI